MAKNKTMLNIHVRNYVAAVFEERLREEGFSCPDDKLLCWYRVQGDRVVNSIVFFSFWSNIPIDLYIGYGIHPLFSEPIVCRSVHFSNRPNDDERFIEQAIIENVPINSMGYTRYSPDIEVYAPGHPGKGIYTLDGIILPQMEKIRTLEEVYAFHKRRRMDRTMSLSEKVDSPLGSFFSISKCFADMALVLGDTEVLPYCAQAAKIKIDWCNQVLERYPNNQNASKNLKQWQALDAVFSSGDAEGYIQELHMQEQKNAVLLRKIANTPC